MATTPADYALAYASYLSAAQYRLIKSADYNTCVRSFGTANLLDLVFHGTDDSAALRKLALFLASGGNSESRSSSILATAYSDPHLQVILEEYSACLAGQYSTLTHAAMLEISPATLDLIITENSFMASAYPKLHKLFGISAMTIKTLSKEPGGMNLGVRSLL